MTVAFSEEWKLVTDGWAKNPKKFQRILDMAIEQEAQRLAGAVREKIAAGKFTPLRWARPPGRPGYGGTKPLNAGGSLKNAVKVTPEGGNYFVGVHYKSGMTSIAAVHEFGATFVVRVTEKMRKFLFGVVFKNNPPTGGGGGMLRLGKHTMMIIRIPARPYLGPTLAQHLPKSPERIAEFVFKALAKVLGRGYTGDGSSGMKMLDVKGSL